MDNLKKAILMNEKDNVATVLSPIKKDENLIIIYNNEIITKLYALDDIEIYHKIAIKSISNGDKVYKYGEVIGKTINNINCGQHVHVDNIESLMVKNEN